MHENTPKLRITKLNNYPFNNKMIIKIKFRRKKKERKKTLTTEK